MAAIEVKNLSRSFSGEVILQDINYKFEGQTWYSISGPNGAGKTTLLRILSGVLSPDQGEINVLGKSLEANYLEAKKSLTWIPSHDGGLFPRLNGRENIEIFANLLGINNVDTLIADWSNIVPFNKALSTPYYKCSTGMKQYLLLFCMTLHQPKVILMDEPFRSLAQDSAITLIDTMKEKFAESCLIFSTHHLDVSKMVGARNLILKGGTLAD